MKAVDNTEIVIALLQKHGRLSKAQLMQIWEGSRQSLFRALRGGVQTGRLEVEKAQYRSPSGSSGVHYLYDVALEG